MYEICLFLEICFFFWNFKDIYSVIHNLFTVTFATLEWQLNLLGAKDVINSSTRLSMATQNEVMPSYTKV